MNKLIQTIALAMVVSAPLNLIALLTSAVAHHTPSHVSNISAQTNVTAKKKKIKSPRTTPVKKKKTAPVQKRTTVTPKKKPVDSNTAAPSNGVLPNSNSPQIKPSTPPSTSKIKPIDPRLGNPTKPGTTTKLPEASPDVPSIPLPTPGSVPNPAGNVPSLPRPNLPNLPSGTTK